MTLTPSLVEVSNGAESQHRTKPVGPSVIVIFGITGDLTSRLLFPALYNLAISKLLPEEFAVAGFASSDLKEAQLRDKLAMDLRRAIGAEANPQIVEWLVSRVRFVQSDFQSPSGWQQLKDVLAQLDRDYHTGGNYLFYTATAPDFFLPLVKRLAQEGLLSDVCRNVVPRTVRLSEAPSFGQPIIVFDSSSRGAIAYRELAKEVSGGAPQRLR